MFKNLSIVLVFLLSAPFALADIATPLERPATQDLDHALTNRLLTIDLVGDRLVAAGRRGHILTSDDAGLSWEQRPVPVASDLVASDFRSDQLGWVVGHDGVVLKTEDGGETWRKMLDGRQAAEVIKKYRETHSDLSEEALYEYERFEMEGSDKPFLTVHFMDDDRGVVLGAFNYAFLTEDGGQTWIPFSHRIDNPMGYHIYSAFEHAGVLYAVGEKGLVLRWDEESERLVAVESPYQGSWFAGVSLGQELLLVGLRGSAYYGSPESGWQRLELTEDSINNVVAISADAALLVGQSGKVFRIDRQGNGFSSQELSSGGMPIYDAALAGDALVIVGLRGARRLPLQNNQ